MKNRKMLLLGCLILASASTTLSEIIRGHARLCWDHGHLTKDHEDPEKCEIYEMVQFYDNWEPKVKLDLSDIYLVEIDNDVLEHEGIDSFDMLDISKNELTHTGILEHLPVTVTNVTMEMNHLTRIEPGDFHHLVNLKFINLGRNQIQELEPETFNGLSSLRELYLDENLISHIDVRFFEDMIHLNYLNLARNQISDVDEALCTYFKQLPQVGLNENEVYKQERCVPTNRLVFHHEKL